MSWVVFHEGKAQLCVEKLGESDLSKYENESSLLIRGFLWKSHDGLDNECNILWLNRVII